MNHKILLKILTAADWANAEAGADVRAPVDIADGYVHFSTVETVQDTLDKWFVGVSDAVMIAFDADDFTATLKWEPARGGVLFPHVYGAVKAAQAKGVWRLSMGQNGAPVAPAQVLETLS